MRLQEIVDHPDTPAGRAFDSAVYGLIFLSLVNFYLEAFPQKGPVLVLYLYVAELTTLIVFTLEYLARLLAAERRLKYVLSFYGIVDLAAVLPTYVVLFLEPRAVAPLLTLRLFRVLKLIRFSRAKDRFWRAVAEIREELILYLSTIGVLIYLAAVGIHYFEAPVQPDAFGSIHNCFWWAIVTLTTVGYGDAYPITAGGKLFTSIVVLLGVGVVAVPAGLFASALTQVRRRESRADPEQDTPTSAGRPPARPLE